jgi:hypothetical protein
MEAERDVQNPTQLQGKRSFLIDLHTISRLRTKNVNR